MGIENSISFGIFSLLIVGTLLFVIISLIVPDSISVNDVGSFYDDQIADEHNFQTIEIQWNHMPLKYKLDKYCVARQDGKIEADIELGLAYITKEIPSITFERVNSGEDILYTCNPELEASYLPEETLAEAELNSYGKVYTSGIVYYYNPYQCYGEAPTLWVHETLHLLGLDDKPSYEKKDGVFYTSEDIMGDTEPSEESCKTVKISDEDKLYLENIYGKI